MKFKYIVATKDNVISRGSVFGSTQGQAIASLTEQGYHVITIKRENVVVRMLSTKITFSKYLSSQNLAFFCRHLNFFINAGVSLVNLNPATAPNKLLANEFSNIRHQVAHGELISSVIEKGPYPQLLCSMVKMGEETGKLGTIFAKMETHFEKQEAAKKEIANMLFYPTITFIAMLLVIGITMLYLVPSFIQMFEAQNMALPPVTLALIAVSNFFVSMAFLYIVIPILFFVVLIKSHMFDKVIFNIPIIKKYFSLVVAARFSAAMALMLDSGLTMTTAIETCNGLFKNNHYKNIIKKMKTKLDSGQSFEKIVAKDFHPILHSMVQLGESTGTLTQSMERCAQFFEKEQTIAFLRLKRLIEPSITIFMGVMLLFIMLAIMLPTFELTGVL